MREWKGVRPIIGIPKERATSYAEVVHSWMTAIAQQGWPHIDIGYHRTDVARHLLAWHLLDEGDWTHLVMLDLDHDHDPSIVVQLCESVSEAPEERQVVTALAFRRGKPYEPIAYRFDDEGLMGPVLTWQPGEVVEVDRIGFGACIIAREVFETLPLPWFAYDYRFVEGRHFPTEDTWFSTRCRDNGIRLWVDTRIRTIHLAIAFVDESTFRGYLEMERQHLERMSEAENGS